MDESKFDLEQIKAVVKIASEADIVELAVESPTLKISVKKAAGSPAANANSAPAAPAGAPAAAPAAAPTAAQLVPIIAPMVGTFYRAPSPDAPPFVDEGDLVDLGQTVCIIEAMKLFNEIQSEVRGRIVRILVENGAPVEFGQPLFLVDPTAVSG